jgi:hypothetical protein
MSAATINAPHHIAVTRRAPAHPWVDAARATESLSASGKKDELAGIFLNMKKKVIGLYFRHEHDRVVRQ